MSKLREDYESTLWRRFRRFVNGEEWPEDISDKEDDAQISEMSEKNENSQIGESNLATEKPNDPEQEIIAEETAFMTDRHNPLARYRKESKEDLFRAKLMRDRLEKEEMLKNREKMADKAGMKIFRRVYKLVSVIVCLVMITLLLMTVAGMPKFGSPNSPANSNEVPQRYIEKGQEETGAVNIVTGMILDYRAFDTLGESHVLFIAVTTVMILLRLDRKKGKLPKEFEEIENDRTFEPKNDVILQKIAFILVPVIILFGVYVILNGHISPGGGFSGGAIIGAGLILHLNAFGFEKSNRFFTKKTFSTVSLCALLFYSIAKCYSFFCGANHLESGIPLGTAGDIISSGLILPLNICVGCVVACTMYAFYVIFRKGSF